MSKLAGLAGGPNLGLAASAVVVVVAGGLYFSGLLSKDVATPEPVALIAPEVGTQATDDAAQEPVAPTVDPSTADLPAAEPPTFSTFRLEPDGQMLVSGRAAPGWDTSILLDDEKLVVFEVDSSGEFAQFLEITPSDQPRVLSLSMVSPAGGDIVVSKDEIIITPADPQIAEVADTAETDVASEVETSQIETPSYEIAGGDNTVVSEEGIVSRVEDAASGSDEAIESDVGSTDQQQAVLLSDETGVRVLQPAGTAPEVASNIALDVISYSDEGEVQLSGRAAGEGFVQVYLDNAPITTSRIEDNGSWRSDLSEVDTGVYTLRIDEVDESGTVTSRVETPFKREDQDVLDQAQATQDESGKKISAVTVQPGSTLWAISREAYGDGVLYVRLFEANRGFNPQPGPYLSWSGVFHT